MFKTWYGVVLGKWIHIPPVCLEDRYPVLRVKHFALEDQLVAQYAMGNLRVKHAITLGLELYSVRVILEPVAAVGPDMHERHRQRT